MIALEVIAMLSESGLLGVKMLLATYTVSTAKLCHVTYTFDIAK
jgi:hypothetical protein